MKCFICGKKIPEGCPDEICEDCERVTDEFYKNRPQDKEKVLKFFRELAKKEEK